MLTVKSNHYISSFWHHLHHLHISKKPNISQCWKKAKCRDFHWLTLPKHTTWSNDELASMLRSHSSWSSPSANSPGVGATADRKRIAYRYLFPGKPRKSIWLENGTGVLYATLLLFPRKYFTVGENPLCRFGQIWFSDLWPFVHDLNRGRRSCAVVSPPASQCNHNAPPSVNDTPRWQVVGYVPEVLVYYHQLISYRTISNTGEHVVACTLHTFYTEHWLRALIA